LEPIIRSIRSVFDGTRARLITLEDNPPTCTLNYSEIPPGQTSSHHSHEWEHEVFIIQGSGTLVCDGLEYAVRAGDALFIPPNVDHYTLNNGGRGNIRRIEVNPLLASQSNVARSSSSVPPYQGGTTGESSGQPPVIRNLSEIDQSDGPARRILGPEQGAVNYVMAFRGLDPGSTAPMHAHPGEHLGFMLEGTVILEVDGVEYPVSAGDVALVPPHAKHEWRSDSDKKACWLVFNPAG
jgi:quercetin dioxygenase-like cupin family protein